MPVRKPRKKNRMEMAARPSERVGGAAQKLYRAHDGALYRAFAALDEFRHVVNEIHPEDLPHRPIPRYRDLIELRKKTQEAYQLVNEIGVLTREIVKMHGGRI